MKIRRLFIFTMMFFLLFYGCAAMVRNAALQGDIRGEISNLGDIEQNLSSDSVLQLVKYPKNGQLTFKITTEYKAATYDARGHLISGGVTKQVVFEPALEKTGIPRNGKFIMHAGNLPAGKYFLAVQPIPSYSPALFSNDGQNAKIIDLSPDLHSPFSINLGKGILIPGMAVK